MEVLRLFIKFLRKNKIKFIVISILICTLVILVHFFLMPISIRGADMDKMIVEIYDEYNVGQATICERNDIDTVCDIVNHIILIPWNNYNSDLLGGGHLPATMEIYCERDKEIAWTLNVYDNMALLSNNDAYFYIPFFQRKKIINICKKYGELQEY